ncbi:DUF1566 domain-containing protein [Motiliproteus sp. SC1-56]|uniref:Lcl domain-containing protein n=1 Tax=Motiliproteus sp. SC1-56 TaxID=2799565 RepID=UPI001A8E4B44|nr:DUF1566 domain-containing protein [Motiliproteus sp. SC1-56]
MSAVASAQTCDPERLGNTPTKRFIIHDDATVTDRVTGLVWTRCAVGQTWADGTCNDTSIKQLRSWFSWQGALDYVANMDHKRPGWTGYSTPIAGVTNKEELKEWRLPTIQELRTLIDRHCENPAINLEVFPNAPAWGFWSASEFSEGPDYAWQVDFKTGETSAHLKVGVSYHLRLVSGSLIPTSKKREAATESAAARWDDGIHDPANPDLELLQHPDDVTGTLPRDGRGEEDWAKALIDGVIKPRASRDGAAEMVVWDQDLIFKETATMPHVRFPHKLHSMWLACENCHDQIFPARFGQSDISMASIYQGRDCGVCHGKVAFSPNNCERCHSIEHAGSGPRWW